MALKVDSEKLITDYKKNGGKTDFDDSLKKVIQYARTDEKIEDISDLAYLLATAKVESDFSLQRWESDFLCGKKGVPYKNKPCDRALNYYRSTGGKKNYYTLGLDKNGLPYFGRGLIQLTGKANYKKYGEKIGVDLLEDGDKALEPKNSFRIATEFLSNVRGGQYKKDGRSRSTFDMARDGDLRLARISVNGGTKSLDKVNQEYELWTDLLKKNKAKVVTATKKTNKRLWLGIGLSVVTIGLTGTLIFLYLKKNNKLPNFMKIKK